MIFVDIWKRTGCGVFLVALGVMVLSSGCMSRNARDGSRYRASMRTRAVVATNAPPMRGLVVAGERRMRSHAGSQSVGTIAPAPAPAVAEAGPGSTTPVKKTPKSAPVVAEAGPGSTTPVKTTRKPAIRRIVVYTGIVRVQVAKPEQAVDRLRALAERMGGYVQSAVSSRVMIRVPAAKFFRFIDALTKDVGEVFDKQIRSEDITAQYLDLQIRLKAQLSVFRRLQELLKKAQNVKEAMLVEKELARLVEQIERIKGRIRYLRQAAALATITVVLVKPTVRHRVISPPPVRSPFRWIRRLGISSLLGYLRR